MVGELPSSPCPCRSEMLFECGGGRDPFSRDVLVLHLRQLSPSTQLLHLHIHIEGEYTHKHAHINQFVRANESD